VLTWLRENACQNSTEPGRRAGSRSDEKGGDMCMTDFVKPSWRRGFTVTKVISDVKQERSINFPQLTPQLTGFW
jgi:hypothetical protein